jgi:hypothetical protein
MGVWHRGALVEKTVGGRLKVCASRQLRSMIIKKIFSEYDPDPPCVHIDLCNSRESHTEHASRNPSIRVNIRSNGHRIPVHRAPCARAENGPPALLHHSSMGTSPRDISQHGHGPPTRERPHCARSNAWRTGFHPHPTTARATVRSLICSLSFLFTTHPTVNALRSPAKSHSIRHLQPTQTSTRTGQTHACRPNPHRSDPHRNRGTSIHQRTGGASRRRRQHHRVATASEAQHSSDKSSPPAAPRF